MSAIVSTLFEQVPGMIIGATVAAGLARAGQRAAARQDRRAEATAALLAPLAAVERLLRQWRHRQLSSLEVTDTMAAWDQAWRASGGALPAPWAHLNRSVRAAVGNSLGGEAALAADRGVREGWAPDEFDYYWWDVALTYFEHVRARLQQAAVRSARRNQRSAAIRYEAWRSDEDWTAEGQGQLRSCSTPRVPAS